MIVSYIDSIWCFVNEKKLAFVYNCIINFIGENINCYDISISSADLRTLKLNVQIAHILKCSKNKMFLEQNH